MEVHNNLQSLLDGVEGKEINKWMYANFSQTNKNPIDTEFYLFHEE